MVNVASALAADLETEDQTACKPGSVPLIPDTRPGANAAAIPLDRPSLDGSRDLPGRLGPARPCPGSRIAPDLGRVVPIRSCSRRGLPCRLRCRRRGALLPHPFTLTRRRGSRRFAFCGAIPGVAPGGRYPPPFRRGARTFLHLPKQTATARPSGPARKWARGAHWSSQAQPWRPPARSRSVRPGQRNGRRLPPSRISSSAIPSRSPTSSGSPPRPGPMIWR